MSPEQLRDVIRALKDAGYSFPSDCPNGYLCIVDPTCIWPSLLEFINIAWIVLAAITGFLLAGWAITMLRGANHNMVQNLRTLVLIFGTLSVALPAVNMLGGGAFLVNKCNVIEVSQEQIQELLPDPNRGNINQENYEHFDIHDSQYDE